MSNIAAWRCAFDSAVRVCAMVLVGALAGCTQSGLGPASSLSASQHDPATEAQLANAVVESSGETEREQAVAAIRARAEMERQSEQNGYPNVFESPSLSELPGRTPSEVAQLNDQLAAQAAAAATEPDAQAYRHRAKWLWGLGARHVEDAEAEIAAKP